MDQLFSVEELIADDSFIQYCNRADPHAVSHWEDYLLRHPDQKETVDEAKSFVKGLQHLLRTEEKEKALQSFQDALHATYNRNEADIEIANAHRIPTRQRTVYHWLAAASIAGLIAGAVWIFGANDQKQTATFSKPHAVPNVSTQPVLAGNTKAETGAGEKKTVWLPDGTKVMLNAKTILKIDSAFGQQTRQVQLEGEAFFDVAHDKVHPFIVRLQTFDVKVLGTQFNVRAYKEDRTSEAALVNGKVEIVFRNKAGKALQLAPNQKAVVSNTVSKSHAPGSELNADLRLQAVAIKPLSTSSDGALIETAWMQNRLEINDETFAELKAKLERWYGVTLTFTSEEVTQYRFTATFEGETIDQALAALRFSYPFQYTRKNNEIFISKE